MFGMSSMLVAATAVVLTAGAAQFASGHDLLSPLARASAPLASASMPLADTPDTQMDHVNRAAKADRMAIHTGEGVATQTFAVRPAGLSNTSVLIRAPVAAPGKEANDVVPVRGPATLKSPVAPKATVACEAPVSVLTDVAKQLAPGRCIT